MSVFAHMYFLERMQENTEAMPLPFSPSCCRLHLVIFPLALAPSYRPRYARVGSVCSSTLERKSNKIHDHHFERLAAFTSAISLCDIAVSVFPLKMHFESVASIAETRQLGAGG